MGQPTPCMGSASVRTRSGSRQPDALRDTVSSMKFPSAAITLSPLIGLSAVVRVLSARGPGGAAYDGSGPRR
jgi:hypothetical protein